MTWLRLAIANITLAPLASAINVLLMLLGTASIVLLLLAGSQLSATMTRDAQGIDLVLGAPGSPVQLILATVYHADVPPGNISLQDAERWTKDPRVESAIPMSLGDSYRGFRIVGTSPDYIDHYGAELAAGRSWQGPMEAVLGSAVAAATGASVGSNFAGAHGMIDGGHEHEAQPYRVVGTLAATGTVLDRLVVTSLESVWDLHGVPGEHDSHDENDGHHDEDDDHHDEDDDHHHEGDEHHDEGDEHHVESAEVHDDDDEHASDDEHQDEAHEHDEAHDHDEEHDHADAHDDDAEAHGDHDEAADDHEDHGDHHDAADHQEDGHEHADTHDEDPEITAMLLTYRSPLAATTLPREIQATGTLQAAAPAFEIARILQLVGVGIRALNAFGWVLVVTAALSIFAALYGSLRSRRGELAMLRCLGATRVELLFYLVLEGLLLSAVGVGLGFLVGHCVTELIGGWLAASRGVSMTGWTWAPGETLLLLGLGIVGLLSAIIPAIQAYRTDVARTLADA